VLFGSGSLAVSAAIRRVVKFSEIERELVKLPRPHAWPPPITSGRLSATTAASSAAWRTINFSVSADFAVKLGPANRGRRLDAAERQAIEQKMRDEGRL
jgi:hypothetical protein